MNVRYRVSLVPGAPGPRRRSVEVAKGSRVVFDASKKETHPEGPSKLVTITAERAAELSRLRFLSVELAVEEAPPKDPLSEKSTRDSGAEAPKPRKRKRKAAPTQEAEK